MHDPQNFFRPLSFLQRQTQYQRQTQNKHHLRPLSLSHKRLK